MAIQYVRENPFRDCADPGNAIPSAACDRALMALEQAIVALHNPIVLLGPVGAGKTLLLRRIVERPPLSIRTVFLPWLNVPADDVIPWIRAFAGSEGAQDDFVAAARTFRARGLRTLLLVDEAQSIPRDSAERLAELVSAVGPAVQVILAGMDGRSLRAAVAAFQGDAEYVELASEVTPQEVATWVHNTLHVEQLSLLNDLDWVELVQRAKGVPRLVRWELERRLATGDLAAALGRKVAGPPGPAPAAKSEEVVALPIVRASSPVAVAARPVPRMRLDGAIRRLATLLRVLVDAFCSLALWSGEACREAVRASRRHTLLLGQALGQRGSEIRDAAASRIEQAGGFVVDRSEDFFARCAATLRNARIRSAQYSTRLALVGRRSGSQIAKGMKGVEPLLRRVAFRARGLAETLTPATGHFATQAVTSLREAVKRGEERVAALVHGRRLAPSSLRPSSKRGRALGLPELRAGSLVVFAIVAIGAFLLGRVTAPPILGSGARERIPPAPVVSSGPPAAPPQVRQDAPQSSGGADGAQQRMAANPPPPVPAPPPQPKNPLRTTPQAPKHILVKIDAHPQARIWIDGHEAGRTPLVRVPLAPGRHNFQVLFSDGRRIHRSLEIRHGTHVVKFS
jgi:AAA domain-containing protein